MEEFIPIEINFLAEADTLPDEYGPYFRPPLDNGIRIPYREKKVGDLQIQFFCNFFHIKIGNHTEVQISKPSHAIEYLKDILTDQSVFYFNENKVEYFRADEFENLSETDWNYYVWSGPFRYVFMENDLDST